MSYRIYIELFKDKKSLRSYQIFGNNEFPSELKEWLISNTKLNKEKLKNNDDMFENIGIKDIEQFNKEVIEKYVFNRLKKDIVVGDWGNEVVVTKNSSLAITSEKTYIYQSMIINDNILFTSWNFFNFLRTYDCLKSMCSLELKNGYTVKISGY